MMWTRSSSAQQNAVDVLTVRTSLQNRPGMRSIGHVAFYNPLDAKSTCASITNCAALIADFDQIRPQNVPPIIPQAVSQITFSGHCAAGLVLVQLASAVVWRPTKLKSHVKSPHDNPQIPQCCVTSVLLRFTRSICRAQSTIFFAPHGILSCAAVVIASCAAAVCVSHGLSSSLLARDCRHSFTASRSRRSHGL